jgi:rod shape-determining protein MreC
MRQRQRFFIVFAVFFVLSLAVLIIFKSPAGNGIQGLSEMLFSPLQKVTYTTFVHVSAGSESQNMKALSDENSRLLTQVVKLKETEKENQALHDQFAAAVVPPKQLLPGTIIGSRVPVAGTETPTEIIINVGKRQGVMPGMAVLSKDMLVGLVTSTSENRAVVRIPVSSDSNIPAKTSKTNAIGIAKGQGEAMLFDNVLLSDSLQRNDLIVTKGDIDAAGRGFPPDLIIGKIAAVHKKASALFQTAEIYPVLQINRLTTVFVYLTEK